MECCRGYPSVLPYEGGTVVKVLMFGWEFPPYISGGLGTACFGLTRGLAEKGTDILFVLPRLQTEHPESHVHLIGANKILVRNIRERIESFKEHVQTLEVDSPLMPYLSAKEYARVIEQLRKLSEEETREFAAGLSGNYGPDLMAEITRYSVIGGVIGAQEQFDVIHSHDWMTSLAGIEAKRSSGKPLVVHVHATEFDRSGEHMNQQVYDIERAGIEAADRVIAVSHLTKEILVNRYSISEDKIRVVHNAVSKEKSIQRLELKRNLKEKVILFLGRITFQKGPEYFIAAARKVIRKVPDVRFVMAGSGDMFNRMVEMAAHLRIEKNFHFTGFLRGRQVERMYALSDLYVMPSVSEPFGIAPLEAMLYDIPVIVSKQSGVAEILDHAVKVDFWDTNKLAKSIIDVLARPEQAREMVEKNSRQLAEIKWEIAADKTMAVYEEVAGGVK